MELGLCALAPLREHLLGTMFTSQTTIRVRYAETDQMQVVYHGNYAQYFEVARAECIRELGFTYKDMEAMGIMMPIVELHTKFLRPAHYDEQLTIKVILKDLPTDHRVEFHHEVYNENEKIANARQSGPVFCRCENEGEDEYASGAAE